MGIISLKKTKPAVFFFLIVLGFLFLFNFLGGHHIKGLIFFATNKVQGFFWQAGQVFSGKIFSFLSCPTYQSEIKHLKKSNYRLLKKLGELAILETENQELKKALGLQKEHSFNFIMARPLSKFTEGDELLLDKGRVDGVRKSMPLVTSEGVLLGKIQEVFNRNATAILVTHPSMKFDVKIVNEKETVLGVVEGQGNLRARLSMVPKKKEISQGDEVITSALGNIFPEGLLVGEVRAIEQDPTAPFKNAQLKLYFLDPFPERLFIIKRDENNH